MTNSRAKGAAGEREFASWLRDHGVGDARRGQQYSGLGGDDVVGLEGVHIEVKRVEKLNLENAMAQAIRDAKDGTPIVVHRKNRGKWLVTMLADDWMRQYKEAHA